MKHFSVIQKLFVATTQLGWYIMDNENTKKTGCEDVNAISSSEKRYCTVLESLEQSLREVKEIRQGKIVPKTWEQYLKESKEKKEDN